MESVFDPQVELLAGDLRTALTGGFVCEREGLFPLLIHLGEREFGVSLLDSNLLPVPPLDTSASLGS